MLPLEFETGLNTMRSESETGDQPSSVLACRVSVGSILSLFGMHSRCGCEFLY